MENYRKEKVTYTQAAEELEAAFSKLPTKKKGGPRSHTISDATLHSWRHGRQNPEDHEAKRKLISEFFYPGNARAQKSFLSALKSATDEKRLRESPDPLEGIPPHPVEEVMISPGFSLYSNDPMDISPVTGNLHEEDISILIPEIAQSIILFTISFYVSNFT